MTLPLSMQTEISHIPPYPITYSRTLWFPRIYSINKSVTDRHNISISSVRLRKTYTSRAPFDQGIELKIRKTGYQNLRKQWYYSRNGSNRIPRLNDTILVINNAKPNTFGGNPVLRRLSTILLMTTKQPCSQVGFDGWACFVPCGNPQIQTLVVVYWL